MIILIQKIIFEYLHVPNTKIEYCIKKKKLFQRDTCMHKLSRDKGFQSLSGPQNDPFRVT